MKKYNYLILVAIAFLFNTACDSGSGSDDGQTTPEPEIENQFTLTNAFSGLIFDKPVDIQNPADGSNRLFIVEQKGVIKVITNTDSVNTSGAQLRGEPVANIFLDINDKVEFNGNELGLLGLAFHPNFENNGLFYVNYISYNPLRTVISQFSVSDQYPNIADPSSEIVLLEIEQPSTIHKGGQLVFGPDDGYLYIYIARRRRAWIRGRWKKPRPDQFIWIDSKN